MKTIVFAVLSGLFKILTGPLTDWLKRRAALKEGRRDAQREQQEADREATADRLESRADVERRIDRNGGVAERLRRWQRP